VQCSDIVTPHRDWRGNRSWRWCEGRHAGVRWRDGDQGLIEVTAVGGPEQVRVIGFNNVFLRAAVLDGPATAYAGDSQRWRQLHQESCREVDDRYLFHTSRRDCWALIMRPGESGDVAYIPNVAPPAVADREPR
jgi:hypothetical protein